MSQNKSLPALEFFSGIGAFAEATRDLNIRISRAFDQNENANTAYQHNFDSQLRNTNLDRIKLEQLPEAKLWWMSPPCTPYTVRGKQRDLDDPRSVSFVTLIDHAANIKPQIIYIENVSGFRLSQAKQFALDKLTKIGYQCTEIDLCPTMFGVPMRRPRHFVVFSEKKIEFKQPESNLSMPLSDFLEDPDDDLFLDDATIEKYGQGFDVVEAGEASAEAICFTKNYARCMKASGSLIRQHNRLRRFSPREILRLMGFSDAYNFPTSLDLQTQWKLVGNSVDVRAVRFLLNATVHGAE